MKLVPGIHELACLSIQHACKYSSTHFVVFMILDEGFGRMMFSRSASL